MDDSQVAIAYSVLTKNTWKGEVAGHETEWEQAHNWTAGTVPLSTEDVLIPGGLTYYPSLTSSANAVAKSIEIETGASITANSYDITVSGSGGAWINQGTFYPGTGKVLFNHGVSAEIVTVAGITNFYDIEIGANTTLEPVSGCVFRIAGTATGNPPTSRANWAVTNSTVEWNGGNQTINNPVGLGGYSGYYNLILSGSGTKTMPATALNVLGDFTLDGTATATADSALTIGGNLKIGEGTTLATGAYDHTVGGSFDNDGTFISTSGTRISLIGSSAQSILGDSATSFEKLTINNSAGVNIYTDITVNDTLTLSNGNLSVGTTTLTINGNVTNTSGFINVTPQSSLSFGGTTALSLANNLFNTTPSINNLTINRTGGVEFSCDFTVNGTLSLQSANPTDIKGTLDMGTNTLLMGATAITIGTGDLTGIVKRTTILANTEYTFGNQYSSVTFPAIGTLPTEISMKISIGVVPSWKTDAIERVYDISQVGGSGTRGLIKAHYLDSELNGNEEVNISFFSYIIPTDSLLDRGRTEINTTENWITLNNADFGNLPGAFDVIEHGFGVSTSNVITWDGSESTDWFDQYNWTPAYSPDSTKLVVIPDASTTPRDPIIADATTDTVFTLTIQAGGILSAGAGTELTIKGSSGAWSCYGTFNAGTGNVLFNHGEPTNVVTVAGTTDFYDIEVGANTTMQPVAGCVLRIEGAGSADMTSQVDFSTINNTVEWNGANQTIVNPYGIGDNSGFYNLILSGSGTKTMPGSEMTVHGDFTISGTASVTAADTIIVLGNTTIDNGATFATGSHHHFLSGNFENNGTFTPTSGGTVSFNGTSAQTISGSSAIGFDNLAINNTLGVTLESDVNVNNVLTFDNGVLNVGANTLGINGTISKVSGNIEVSSTSSLSFGGTTAITLNDNLFNSNPIINNLTINRSGGVTLGNENITVNGTLTLTSGTLTLAANTLTIAGTAPSRTSGNIDASHASATLAFENPAAITLPGSLFSGNVNNMTIIGAGGITAGGDFTIDGILNLQSANPSSVKGSLDMSIDTLTMGASSTTIGQGDVSGIIKRTSIASNTSYTMGNQYTTIYFPNVGTLPTEMRLKVTLGSAPTWRTGAIERVYDFIQTGGSGTEAVLQSHYLDSELNGNDENKLVEWMHIYAYPLTIEYGRSDYNTNENWVSVSHVNVGVFASVFGAIEMVVDEFELQDLTWNGSTSTSWVTATNWTPQGAPSDETVVTIPDAATTTYDPYIPETAICGKVIIESGGILNSVDNGQLTVKGADSAWVNNGTFTPGTGTIIFANGNEDDTVTVAGTSSFYNLTVTEKTHLQPALNSIINIEGALSNENDNGILDFSSYANTVCFNGGKEQYVVNPGGSYGYYHLSFSEDGLIVLPESSLKIFGNLSINANISATGNTILMVGTSAQTIEGDTASTLNNLTIDNASGVTLTNTALTTVSGSLVINSGKVFEIAAGQKLTVSGSITNSAGNSGLVLKSDATGTASLIHNSDNIAVTIERYISGSAEDWHFISSPVADQEISGSWLPSGTYGNGTGYDLYLWNEPTSCWIYKLNTTSTVNWNTVHPGADFMVGRGYLYSVQAANPTKSFAGELNNGDQNIPITYSGTVDSVKGFNLVGNPYASSIDWGAASGWTRINLVESGGGYNMWIWNPAANNYGVYNSADAGGTGTNSITRYIAPMQGFFVEAASAGNLGMTNAVRVHDGASDWFKNYQQQINNLSLIVTADAGYGSDEILLEFNFDKKEKGAKKLFSHVSTAPALYMNSFGEDLAVGHFTTPEETQMVPVNFNAGKDGNFTINCHFDMSSFELVWLEDREVNYFMDMKQNPEYKFSASVSDDADRFVLYFGAVKAYVNDELPARIFYDGNNIMVDLSLVTDDASVQVIDLSGRVLIKQDLIGEMTNKINIPNNMQIVLVYVSTSNASVCRKILLNKY